MRYAVRQIDALVAYRSLRASDASLNQTSPNNTNCAVTIFPKTRYYPTAAAAFAIHPQLSLAFGNTYRDECSSTIGFQEVSFSVGMLGRAF